MTEREAEAWAARLTRIWQPERLELEYGISPIAFFDYRGYICTDICLAVDHELEDIHFDLYIGGPYHHVSLMANMSGGMGDSRSEATKHLYETRKDLLDEWLPFFRRNCWLSGLPIEASGHEKAEWIQGFTREEIDAWNLKL